jgi:hypothetical protein
MKEPALVYKVLVANLTYAGAQHGGLMADLAQTVSDVVSSHPERSACLIFLPVTGVYGAGAGLDGAIHAQRAATAIMEDAACKLEATTGHCCVALAKVPLCKWW